MSEIIITTKEELESCIDRVIKKNLGAHFNSNKNEGDTYLNVTEAAAFLNLAKQTLYGFTSQSQIPFIKRAKRLLFKKSDLEKWLMEGRCKSISELENDLKNGKSRVK